MAKEPTTRMALALALLLLCAACGADSPSGPTPIVPGACRSYPSDYTTTSSDGSAFSTSCSFDRSRAALNCTSPGATSVRTYASVGDFVDEGQWLGRVLAVSEKGESVGWVGHGASYYYDAQRRLARWTGYGYSRFFREDSESVATAWDSLGRPTAVTVTRTASGSASGGRPPSTCFGTIAYNDTARTITRSPNCYGEGDPPSETYDANYIRISASGTIVFTPSATVEVCK